MKVDSHPIPSFDNVEQLLKSTELELEKSRIQLRYMEARNNRRDSLLPTPTVVPPLPSDPAIRPNLDSLQNNKKFPFVPFQRKTFVNPPLLGGLGEAYEKVYRGQKKNLHFVHKSARIQNARLHL